MKKHVHELLLTPGSSLSIEPAGMGDRFSTKLIGFSTKYIITRLPQQAKWHEYLAGNNVIGEKTCYVRYLHEGSIYGFRSKVLWTLKAPDKLLFLSYPGATEVEEVSLRKSKRICCCLPAQIMTRQYGIHAQYDGMILNLSTGGCEIAVDAGEDEHDRLFDLTSDDRVELLFMVETSKLTRVEGSIKKNQQKRGHLIHCP